MPLNGNTYVAPTWRNGGPPALDAAELQAISDSIVRNQTGVGSLQTNMSGVQAAVAALQGDKVQIEAGSYVGTGTHGASSPNSIMCSSNVKCLFLITDTDVWANNNPCPLVINGDETIRTYGYDGNGGSSLITTMSGNIVKWYGSTAAAQLNKLNSKYRFVAIC